MTWAKAIAAILGVVLEFIAGLFRTDKPRKDTVKREESPDALRPDPDGVLDSLGVRRPDDRPQGGDSVRDR